MVAQTFESEFKKSVKPRGSDGCHSGNSVRALWTSASHLVATEDAIAICGGYSFARPVRNSPVSVRPTSATVGFTASWSSCRRIVVGRLSRFPWSMVVGLIPTPPNFHCAKVYFFRRPISMSKLTMAVRQILALSSGLGSAGCSRSVAPPESMVYTVSTNPRNRSLIPTCSSMCCLGESTVG